MVPIHLFRAEGVLKASALLLNPTGASQLLRCITQRCGAPPALLEFSKAAFEAAVLCTSWCPCSVWGAHCGWARAPGRLRDLEDGSGGWRLHLG